MKTMTLLTKAIILTATLAGGSAQAGFFDSLKDNLQNSANQAANDAINQTVNDAVGNTSHQASGTQYKRHPSKATAPKATVTGPSMADGPAANLTALTKCAGVPLSNIKIGEIGSYTFNQGMSVESRSGLINRRTGSVTNGCILPSLSADEVLYVEADTAKITAMGGRHSFEMQCVESAHPEKGALKEKMDYPYSTTQIAANKILLHCGSSVTGADPSECASGSNGARNSAWDKKLKQRGKTMFTFRAVRGYNVPPQGDKLYCQYYNPKTGTSLFSIEYQRLKS